MSNYSRWKATIEKHDREDGICPLLDDVYEQGMADAIEPIRAIIIESEKMMWCADKTLEKIKEQLKKGE